MKSFFSPSLLFTLIFTLLLSPFSLAQDSSEPTGEAMSSDISVIDPDMIVRQILKERYDRLEQMRELMTGPYPFRRYLSREDVVIKSKRVRLKSGKRVNLIWGRPKGAKVTPAVFSIDVEATALAHSSGRNYYRRASREEINIRNASYLLKSPFGSNLLGQGFTVAYVVADDFETMRSAKTADWLEIFERVRDFKEVDENSYFLLSTKEYANLSLHLAGAYSFSGFILEEPQYLLFSKNTYENVITSADKLSSEQIWKKTDPSRADAYLRILGQITTPIFLVRSSNSPAFGFNEKTLLPKLDEANTYYESLVLDNTARSLKTFGRGSGVMDVTPEVQYNVDSTQKWIREMVTYLKANTITQPQEIASRRLPY